MSMREEDAIREYWRLCDKHQIPVRPMSVEEAYEVVVTIRKRELFSWFRIAQLEAPEEAFKDVIEYFHHNPDHHRPYAQALEIPDIPDEEVA